MERDFALRRLRAADACTNDELSCITHLAWGGIEWSVVSSNWWANQYEAKNPFAALPIYGGACAVTLAECSGLLCEDVYIETLYADSGELGNDVWIKASGTESALNCPAGSGVYLKLSGISTSKKEVYALLSMAFAMDKPVTIRVMQNSTDCVVAYVFVNR